MGQLTPLAELPDRIENWGDIAWKIDAGPYIDTEKIGLDIGAARRMLGFAGLRAASVYGYQGDQSEFQTNVSSVTGINPDGSATGAGTASASKTNTQRTKLEQQYDPVNGNMFIYRWPIAHVGIDRAEVASRVGEDRRRKPDEPREIVWARHVDRALRSGIVDAAFQGLVKDPWEDNSNKTDLAFYAALESLALGSWHDPYFAVIYAGIRQYTPLLTTYLHDRRHRDHNHSRPPFKAGLLFPNGFQPERVAVTALLAKTGRLVRPIPVRA